MRKVQGLLIVLKSWHKSGIFSGFIGKLLGLCMSMLLISGNVWVSALSMWPKVNNVDD